MRENSRAAAEHGVGGKSWASTVRSHPQGHGLVLDPRAGSGRAARAMELLCTFTDVFAISRQGTFCHHPCADPHVALCQPTLGTIRKPSGPKGDWVC